MAGRPAGSAVVKLVAAGLGAAALAGSPTTQPERAAWPMWGGGPTRNAVAIARGIPHDWDVETKRNIRWTAPLGSVTYGGPVVAGGRVFVGTNNAGEYRPHSKGDKGCLLCFDERTGRLLWQATHDKLPSGPANDWPEQGVAATPLVDGERVYYVSNRCELVCADVQGFHDGKNDGPYTAERHTELLDADFVWILDMMGTLGVYPHNLAACAPVGAGDLIFVCTGNAVDDDHEKPPAPQAPSFIAVNKHTGAVVWQRNDPGANILHGQWSSPAYGVSGGVPQVVFGGGDGWCYAFEPLTGAPLWKFDLNPKDSVWQMGGRGTKTSIVATPVIHDDRVFLAVGDDPEQCSGPGHLYAIDATQRGDITEKGRVWRFGGKDFGRTIASVAVADGLLYAVDLDGFLSCLDVKSGERLWQHDMEAAVWGSPVVADGKVFLGNADGEVVVVRHGRTLEELARHDMRQAIYTSAAVAGDTLYVATQRTLYAIGAPRPAAGGWPMFRGDGQLTGAAGAELPAEPVVRWKHTAAGAVLSTAAIVDGVVYVGCSADRLLALELSGGRLKWQYETADAVEASPLVAGGMVYIGDMAGVFHACDAATGARRWSFKTGAQISSSANCVDGRVLFGSYDGTLYCLNAADGAEVWKYDTDDRLHATPAVANGHVLIAGCDGNLHVVKLDDGAAVRRVPLGSVTGCSPGVQGSRAFVGTYGGQMLGLDWQAGNVAWRYEDAERGQPFLSSPAVAGGLVIAGGRDRRLRAFEAESGAQRWVFATRGRIDSSPVVVGERVFVGSADGRLYAIGLESGEEVWRFEAGAAIYASPAVAEDCLVIGAEDGVIYCLGAALPAAGGD